MSVVVSNQKQKLRNTTCICQIAFYFDIVNTTKLYQPTATGPVYVWSPDQGHRAGQRLAVCILMESFPAQPQV